MKKLYNVKAKLFGKLRTDYIDGVNWKVVNPDKSFYCELDDGRKIVPEDGFITDFASIPRLFRGLLPATGDGKKEAYGPDAVIHDYLYVNGKIEEVPIHKRMADDIFLAAMEASHVEKWQREIMHWAVVRFGGPAWNKHNHPLY